MFRASVFSILCLTFSVYIGVKSDKDCDALGILIYEDLGCTPVKKDGKGCPIKYECGDFSRNNNSCLFRGKSYALLEQIKNELTYASCDVGCFCNDGSGSPTFTCAVLDCPEWLGAPVKPGCYRKFEVDGCCSVGMICPSEDKALAECNVDGKTYKEGEKIFPKNTCLKCVCDKNWNENLEPPICKRILCNTQINRAEELHNKCAPCYFGKETLCCPDTWICPTSSDQITKVNNDADSNSELSCAFGSKVLKLGEGFQRKVSHYGTEKNVQCECVVPPLLTCKGL